MVKIGDTFRYVYADGNVLWKVIKKKSEDVYLCEIVNEKFEYNGKTLDSDYAGVQKVFLVSEIEHSINIRNIFKKINKTCDEFYENLNSGDIVHYHDGFSAFVRCRINENKDLVPFALVGNWRDYDLPKRRVDGTIELPYYCRKILEKEPFKPNATNIWEYPEFSRKDVDPTNLPEIDISVPDQTEEEKIKSNLWVRIKEIQKVVNSNESDPDVILNSIKNLIIRIEK